VHNAFRLTLDDGFRQKTERLMSNALRFFCFFLKKEGCHFVVVVVIHWRVTLLSVMTAGVYSVGLCRSLVAVSVVVVLCVRALLSVRACCCCYFLAWLVNRPLACA
jgi:hypothetical protein